MDYKSLVYKFLLYYIIKLLKLYCRGIIVSFLKDIVWETMQGLTDKLPLVLVVVGAVVVV